MNRRGIRVTETPSRNEQARRNALNRARRLANTEYVLNLKLRIWKELWDFFTSDDAIREYIIGPNSTYTLRLNSTSPIIAPQGSLYIPSTGGEGHFIAYEFNGNKIRIFDSSGYAYQEFSNNPRIKNSIRIRSNRSIININNNPQDICQGDTFCQTWSLAWLSPNLRKLTKLKKTTHTTASAINSMHTIIHNISRNRNFLEWMNANKVLYTTKIIEIIKKRTTKQVGATKGVNLVCKEFNNTDKFLHFTQHIPKEYVAKIMLDKV
jgi:hypothetical protein